MTAYYNENDPYAAQWLRNLIAENLIAPGDVDARSIRDVQPRDIAGYTQCHFFAGIGGWSFALRLAGWPDERPVWTGSCPCQPFSVAGKQAGFDDERHLWPEFRRLIAERGPSTILGEQVAGASDWLRLVRGDLEEMAYAVGAIPIEAASAGADHYRDRYWFVAYGNNARQLQPEGRIPAQREWDRDGGEAGALAHADGARSLPAPLGGIYLGEEGAGPRHVEPERQCVSHLNAVNDPSLGWGEGWTEYEFRSRGLTASVASIDGCQYLECPDGKWRRLPPPRVRWLGNGIPARVAKLRAFGNAIDPRPAAAFVQAAVECLP